MAENELKSREAVSAAEVASLLRRQIVEGAYQSGQRVPTHEALIEQTGASKVTVQRALDLLREEGFVRARRGSGTFVSEHPPHHFHFGMVFSDHPDQFGRWRSRYWQTLHEQAMLLAEATDPHRLHLYYDVNPDEHSVGLRRLMEDVSLRRLGGVIFVRHPGDFERVGLFTALRSVPRVTIGSHGASELGFHRVCLDHEDMVRKGAHRLAQMGVQRAAVLAEPGFVPHLDGDEKVHRFVAELERQGLKTEPAWVQFLHSTSRTEPIRSTLRLLMRGPADDRPDGLLFLDDHLTEPGCDVLADLGFEPGRRPRMVSLANFPDRPATGRPIIRLGFNLRELLSACLGELQRQIQGQGEALTMLPARFEEELLGGMAASPRSSVDRAG